MANLVLDWGDFGALGTNLAGGGSVETDGMIATVGFTSLDDGATATTTGETQYVAGGETFDTNSGLKLYGLGGDGSSESPTSETVISFAAADDSGFSDNVEDVSFRINDVDEGVPWDKHVDVVTITAYDAEGNEIPVTLTAAGDDIVDGNKVTGANGHDFTNEEAGSVLVEIAGPVARIVVNYANSEQTDQKVVLSDINYSTIADDCEGDDDTIVGTADDDLILGMGGDDTLSGGGGDDLIYGGAGDDTVNGNSGDDILFGDGANGPDENPNLIENGSFEDVTGLTPTGYGYYGTGGVAGWTAADPTHGIDIHGDSRGGVDPADGQYWADLEATPGNVVLGQDVAGVEDDQLYLMTFSAGDRLTDDNTFRVIWNGEVVEVKGELILDPVNGDMQQYSVVLTGGSGDGSNRLEFEGLGEANRRGVSIDDVKMSAVSGEHSECDGDDVINGGAGDDLIFGGGGQDTITGGAGDDIIYGDDNDDDVSGDSGSGSGSGGGSGGGSGSGGHASGGGSGSGGHASGGGSGAGGSGGHGSGGGAGAGGSGGHGSGGGSGSGGHGSSGGSGGGTGGGSGSGGSGGGSSVDACDLTEGVGTNGDTILGGAGNDTIYGMSGQDYLSGGNGDDTIFGGTGDDRILGDAGDDTLSGDDGDDCIEGGKGNDTLTGGAGADTLKGGDDRDLIFGAQGDTVDGGSGGDDYDRLALDFDQVDYIEYTSADQEDGIVHYTNGETLEFEEIEKIVPCFTPGTMILTANGEVPVETLKLGDKVVTRDNGVQEVRWIGTKALTGRLMLENPHLRPVLIRKGALGRGLPERDMMVSPNHRMLVANDKTSLMFEEREVLVAAKHIIDQKGIQQVDTVGVSYVHMMFDNHEVVLGNGAWTESFQPGDYSLKGIGNAQRTEIFELFPELRESHGREKYVAARRTLKRAEARLLM